VLVASESGENASLDKFSNYTVTSNWTSLIHNVISGKYLSYIDDIVVITESFASGGRVDVTLQYNQNSSNSGAKEINTINTRRHVVKINQSNVEDFRLYLSFANGSATVPVKVRSITVNGHYIER